MSEVDGCALWGLGAVRPVVCPTVSLSPFVFLMFLIRVVSRDPLLESANQHDYNLKSPKLTRVGTLTDQPSCHDKHDAYMYNHTRDRLGKRSTPVRVGDVFAPI